MLEWTHTNRELVAHDGRNEYRICKKMNVLYNAFWNVLTVNGKRRAWSPSVKDCMDSANLIAGDKVRLALKATNN